jgi:hypothetical protein
MKLNKVIVQLGALSAFVLGVTVMASGVQAQQAGTTLSASKTAEGYTQRTIVNDWSLQKTASPSSLEIKSGDSATVNYTLTVGKTVVSDTTVHGVRGQVCVTNGGDRPTEGLKIVDQVEYKVGSGAFQDLDGASYTITPSQQLGAGESMCYPYDFTFTPLEGAEYRNVAHVTITNHSGWLPGGNQCSGPDACPFGPDPKVTFSVPTTPVTVLLDDTATLVDSLTCPTGFTCTPSVSPMTWNLTGAGTINYTVNVHNDSAVCGQNVSLINTATLTEDNSLQTHVASATVNIYTGVCATPTPTPNLGCTRTIGYWKTHAGIGKGNQVNVMYQYLPVLLGTVGGAKTVNVTTEAQAVALLNKAYDASNGINNLYAQLLGTKLDIKLPLSLLQIHSWQNTMLLVGVL